MANTQIGTVTVPALVIALNNFQFVQQGATDTVIGMVLEVPCRDILFDNVDRWAVPQKNFGIFPTLAFPLKEGQYLAQPTYDSFGVFRIRYRNSFTEWVIYGSKADLINSCATCCDGDPQAMPGIDPAFSLKVAPCQLINVTNTGGTPQGFFGLPTLGIGQNYFPYGGLNNVPLTSANANGYSTVTALLVFLNASWTPYVWTATPDNLTLIATGGVLNSTLCVNVIAITPS